MSIVESSKAVELPKSDGPADTEMIGQKTQSSPDESGSIICSQLKHLQLPNLSDSDGSNAIIQNQSGTIDAQRSTIQALSKQVNDLESKLSMEEMNGMAIMECRNLIQKELGVSAASLPFGNGGAPVISPYFDDLIAALVHTVKKMRNPPWDQQVVYIRKTKTMNASWLPTMSVIPSMAQTATTDNYPFVPTGSMQTSAILNLYLQNAAMSQTATAQTRNPYFVGVDFAEEPVRIADGKVKIRDGMATKLTMPDGTIIDVAKDGSYQIIDKDAKVIYRAARIRDFNRYLNASDLLEDFIKFCGENGVRKGEMMALPINLFIGWIIIKAAEADGDPTPETPLKVADLRKPRCKCCGQFISRRRTRLRLDFCGTECIDRALEAAR